MKYFWREKYFNVELDKIFEWIAASVLLLQDWLVTAAIFVKLLKTFQKFLYKEVDLQIDLSLSPHVYNSIMYIKDFCWKIIKKYFYLPLGSSLFVRRRYFVFIKLYLCKGGYQRIKPDSDIIKLYNDHLVIR